MADLIPAPRPVPTTEDRLADARSFRTWMSDTDREQLDAEAACARQERDDALDDRDAYREARDVAQQLAAFRQGVIDRHRQELGAAGEVIAVVRDAVERIDRALAAYDTQPGAAPVEPEHYAYPDGTCAPDCPGCSAATPGLGSPSPRAQDQP